MFPENPPLHQYGHFMVYVPETGQHLMYPGHWSVVSNGITTSHGFGGDIWEYMYPENQWVEHEADSGPTGRYWGTMVHDPDGNRLVLFGGHGSREFDDTWSYDIDSQSWEIAVQEDKPSKRIGVNMAYDPENKAFILFGGQNSEGSLADTWVMDTEAMQWIEVVEQEELVDDPVQDSAIPEVPLDSVLSGILVTYIAWKLRLSNTKSRYFASFF